MDIADAESRLKVILLRDGIPAALAFLNTTTRHRYTAMHRFDAGTLRTLHFFDRDDPAAGPGDDLPVEATYCVYVRDAGGPFRLDDALTDMRVNGHPKQAEVRAYCGVPLIDEEGKMFGTLCHFDTEPTPTDSETVTLMESFGPFLRMCDRVRKMLDGEA